MEGVLWRVGPGCSVRESEDLRGKAKLGIEEERLAGAGWGWSRV